MRAVERDERNQRPNPHPSYLASANKPSIVTGSVLFAPFRWKYIVAYTSIVVWDVANKRFKLSILPSRKEVCTAYNQYESNNTATTFGHGTPVSQGSGTLTPGPIPSGEPVTLLLRVGEEASIPVFEFYAVNPVIAGCNP